MTRPDSKDGVDGVAAELSADAALRRPLAHESSDDGVRIDLVALVDACRYLLRKRHADGPFDGSIPRAVISTDILLAVAEFAHTARFFALADNNLPASAYMARGPVVGGSAEADAWGETLACHSPVEREVEFCARAHGDAARARDRAGDARGAAELRRVENLLWALRRSEEWSVVLGGAADLGDERQGEEGAVAELREALDALVLP